MSRTPGPERYDPLSPLIAARTPGLLGVRDAADPEADACLGDTPGSLGVNDAAAQLTTGAVDPSRAARFGGSSGGGSSAFPAAAMLQSAALAMATGPRAISLANPGINIEGNGTHEISQYRSTLLRTRAGRDLFEKYEKSDDFEIHITQGALGGSLEGGALGQTRTTKGGKVFHITLDINKIRYKALDEFDSAEVLYHEIKAHIDLHHDNLQDYDSALNQAAEKRGAKNIHVNDIKKTVTNFSSASEQDQLTREKIEHLLYGTDASPLSKQSPPPPKGTPAAEILEQLNALRKKY